MPNKARECAENTNFLLICDYVKKQKALIELVLASKAQEQSVCTNLLGQLCFIRDLENFLNSIGVSLDNQEPCVEGTSTTTK